MDNKERGCHTLLIETSDALFLWSFPSEQERDEQLGKLKGDPSTFELIEDENLEDISEDEFTHLASLGVPLIEIQ